MRKIARAVAELRVTRQQMDRRRIVNAALYSLLLERLLQCLPLRRTNRVDVVHVLAVIHGLRSLHARAFEQLVVTDGVRLAGLRPGIQVGQLDAKHSALNSLQPVVVSLEDVLILALSPPVAQHPDGPVERGIIGDDGAAFAIRAEIFARIEAEAANVPDAADRASFVEI